MCGWQWIVFWMEKMSHVITTLMFGKLLKIDCPKHSLKLCSHGPFWVNKPMQSFCSFSSGELLFTRSILTFVAFRVFKNIGCNARISNTHQGSNLIRSCSVLTNFNYYIAIITLQKSRLEGVTLNQFKTLLLVYYERALARCYCLDDPRSFKTICRKCNTARLPDTTISCCF